MAFEARMVPVSSMIVAERDGVLQPNTGDRQGSLVNDADSWVRSRWRYLGIAVDRDISKACSGHGPRISDALAKVAKAHFELPKAPPHLCDGHAAVVPRPRRGRPTQV